MSIDLALILVVLTAFSAVVVAFNRFYYARAGADSDNTFLDNTVPAGIVSRGTGSRPSQCRLYSC